MSILFATPVAVHEPPAAVMTVLEDHGFDETAFMSRFCDALKCLRDAGDDVVREAADAHCEHLLNAAYESLEMMSRRITPARIALRMAIKRARLAYDHISDATPPRTFEIGQEARSAGDVGIITGCLQNALGWFYQLTTADEDVIEIFGQLAE